MEGRVCVCLTIVILLLWNGQFGDEVDGCFATVPVDEIRFTVAPAKDMVTSDTRIPPCPVCVPDCASVAFCTLEDDDWDGGMPPGEPSGCRNFPSGGADFVGLLSCGSNGASTSACISGTWMGSQPGRWEAAGLDQAGGSFAQIFTVYSVNMTKDRLEEFRSKSSKWHLTAQNSTDSFPDLDDVFSNEQMTLLYTEEQWAGVDTFLERATKLQNNLRLLKSYVEDVKIKHSQLLMNPGEHTQLTRELNHTMDAFKALSSSSRYEIKRMNEEIEQIKKDHESGRINDSSAIDLRIRKNHVTSLSTHLNNVLRAYAEEQAKYRDRCIQKISSYLKITKRQMTDDDIDDAIESGKLYDFTEGLMLETQREKENLLDNVKLRHEDILRLEASVRELHDIFQDMAMLVESQGDMVNQIDKNVEAAVEYAREANKNMKAAVEMKASGRKKKIIMVILCIVLSFVLFIIGSTFFCFYMPFC
uniref:t-SNARE coiled-coil homology domain-containing protein n=1 Tax=Plectus sambesii TaxID=2011161 RepID=A0A914WAJ1_9BILA